MDAILNEHPLRVLKRSQVAYPAGINTQDNDGGAPLVYAVMNCNVEYVDHFLEMGSCAGLQYKLNAFDYTDDG
jgi:ankyrin repeat protein